jgi:hypothetical protein
MPSDTASTVRAAAFLPEGGPALPSHIFWGAVIAGSLIAAVIAAMLNIFGAAIGATAVDAVAQATPGAARMGIGAAIWLVIASTLALAAGGYIAARLSGTANDTDGILHGLAVWAVAFLVSAVLIGNLLAGLAYGFQGGRRRDSGHRIRCGGARRLPRPPRPNCPADARPGPAPGLNPCAAVASCAGP